MTMTLTEHVSRRLNEMARHIAVHFLLLLKRTHGASPTSFRHTLVVVVAVGKSPFLLSFTYIIMKFSIVAFTLLCGSTTSAWSPPTSLQTRRDVLQQSLVGAATILVTTPSPAFAGLLDEFGTDPIKIQQETTTTKNKAPAVAQPKAVSNMEPNLRSNYYYPTNKKRYLPRIKKCNDAIPGAAEAIGLENWESAQEFVTQVADDIILPMRLYTSSLLGGGTNVKVSFATDMKRATDDFEKAQKKLTKAIAKRDRETSSKALEDLASALQAYRESGKLLGPDGGGDIPSVDEIRRSACRVQGRSFEQKVKDRDARLKQEAAVAMSN